MSREAEVKLIDEVEIPGKIRRRTAQWLRLFKKIPREGNGNDREGIRSEGSFSEDDCGPICQE